MRTLVPILGVLFLAALVGCGGDGIGLDPTTTSATTSTTATTSNASNGTGVSVPAGTYPSTFTGQDNAATPTSFSGSGTANVASNGTITLDYTSVAAGGTTGTTTRRVVATVSTAGVATGTLTVGTGASRTILPNSTVVKNANGSYLLTIKTSTGGSVVETDLFTLSVTSKSYAGAIASGSDNRGGRYNGTGTATLTSNNALTLNYTSIRSLSGTFIQQPHSLVTTLLANGTINGSLNLGGSGTTGSQSATVTGTWSLNASNVLTLTLNYVNTRYAPSATTTETLVLTRQ